MISSLSFFNGFWSHCTMCGILAPWPGIKFMPPATEPRRLNHWMAREVAVISSSFSFSSLVPGESLGLDPGPSLQTPLLSQLPASLPCVNCMWSMLRAKHYLSDGATRQKQAAQFLPTWDDRPARKSKYQGDDWINGKWEVLKSILERERKSYERLLGKLIYLDGKKVWFLGIYSLE